MKHLIYTGLICVLAIFSGCKKDFLDKLPDGVLTKEDAFKDPNLARGVLSNAYTNIPGYFDRYHWWSMLSPKSDEAVDTDMNGTGVAWGYGTLSPSNNPIRIQDGPEVWGVFWSGIRKTNVFIENIHITPINDQVTSTAITTAQRDQWVAEAKVLRAFYHLELMKAYGAVSIMDRAYSPDFDFGTVKKNTFDECARWIAKECDAALPFLPVRRKPTGNSEEIGIGRISSMIALAIKARALLYNASPLHNPSNDLKKWADARDAAKAVLDLANTSGEYKLWYSPTPTDGSKNVYDLFKQKDNGTAALSEVIWQHNYNNGHFTNVNSIPTAGGAKAGACPSQELVDAFETISGEPAILGYSDEDHLQPIPNPDATDYNPADPYKNRDPRLTGYVYYDGAYWGKRGASDYYLKIFEGGADGIRADWKYTRTGYYIKKFTDPTRGNGLVSNPNPEGQAYWPIFRLAEFYLNYAEASNEAEGPTQTAREAINAIRKRAGMPDIKLKYASDQTRFRERIRNERRIELAFEEHRFYDVRRWNILKETDKLATGMRIVKDGTKTTYNRFVVEQRKAWTDKYRILPIPLNDEVKMPAYEQNYGW